MSAVSGFELILLSLVAMVALHLVARRLGLPPAVALLVGGVGMAFVPGLPPLELDPDLVLVVILPPLLMYGGYFTVWEELKRNLPGVMSLAIGAVIFTTCIVGVVAHLVVPSLPWAVCFALGAIVSPPDAVAAKAILERLALPRRMMVLLEGESLLNDAAGLVLFRFALAAALTGQFSLPRAGGEFAILAIGGVAVGCALGYLLVWIWRRLNDAYLVLITSMLAAWGSYILGEKIGVSGVIASVCCGLVVGWHQHAVLSASSRMRASSFWQTIIFVFEALVFILIGLSLHGVMLRVLRGADPVAWHSMGWASIGVVIAVIAARFVWIFGIEILKALRARIQLRARLDEGEERPGLFSHAKPNYRAATVMSWAGMRGVVTLAVALSLPEGLPGRDLVLIVAFAVILVTVVVQGLTIGTLIRWVLPATPQGVDTVHLSEPHAWARLQAAQFAAIEPLVHDADGTLLHPRLYEQYKYRAELSQRLQHLDNEPEYPHAAIVAHYDIVLAALGAARQELLRLHRSGQIQDEMMHALEHDLDLQEITACHARGSD